MKKISILLVLSIILLSCNTDTAGNKSNSKTKKTDVIRDTSDPVFISHKGISKAVTEQIWKEIILGDYGIPDVKLFDLGIQTSTPGAKELFQNISYGLQVEGDNEIFRLSLRAEIKNEMLLYQLNEKQYYSCKEALYHPNDFSIEMKTALSRLIAEGFLKRKVVELTQ